MQFVYCDKRLGNQIIFCKKSCIQYAVKFVNAVTVPITCNHPKIDPGFPLAIPRVLIRFLAWTKLAQAKLRYCSKATSRSRANYTRESSLLFRVKSIG